MSKGRFIVLDGVDNSGKTTISKLIMSWLDELSIKSIWTKHPGATPVGMELRQILKHSPEPINANAQALMFAADNSMFMHQILEPSIDTGTWIIGDRNNFISSMAYQISSGCSMDELDKVHDATLQTYKIDLLLIFKCGWEESRRRKYADGSVEPDRYEDGGKSYFDKLTKCYDRIKNDTVRLSKFMDNPSNVYFIDAEKPVNEVFENVKQIIETKLLQQ